MSEGLIERRWNRLHLIQASTLVPYAVFLACWLTYHPTAAWIALGLTVGLVLGVWIEMGRTVLARNLTPGGKS